MGGSWCCTFIRLNLCGGDMFTGHWVKPAGILFRIEMNFQSFMQHWDVWIQSEAEMRHKKFLASMTVQSSSVISISSRGNGSNSLRIANFIPFGLVLLIMPLLEWPAGDRPIGHFTPLLQMDSFYPGVRSSLSLSATAALFMFVIPRRAKPLLSQPYPGLGMSAALVLFFLLKHSRASDSLNVSFLFYMIDGFLDNYAEPGPTYIKS